MALGSAKAPFSHPDWLFELKYDGFRALAHIDGKRTQLVSRNGHLVRRSAFDAYRNGKTVAVCDSHDFGSLAAFSFPDFGAPFFAGAKLPSMKASSTSRTPRAFKWKARASRIPFMTRERTHCGKRRWHVWYDG